jgi:hypothetical protein
MSEHKEKSEKKITLVLKELGLDQSHVHKGVLNTGDTPGPTYFSTDPEFKSAIKLYTVSIKRLDDLKHLIGNFVEPDDEGRTKAEHAIPEPWPDEKNNIDPSELREKEERDIHQALRVYLLGDSDRVKSYKNIIEKRYFPVEAAVFTGEDIVVTKDHPLIIKSQGHNPAIVNYGTITLEPGGQIICETNVIMAVQKFVKAGPNADG